MFINLQFAPNNSSIVQNSKTIPNNSSIVQNSKTTPNKEQKIPRLEFSKSLDVSKNDQRLVKTCVSLNNKKGLVIVSHVFIRTKNS